MTRPASFNTTWANAGQQVAGESDTKTQEFMKTGWEGGSDKKPPHAPTQNYHMQKTDLALQEIERQGLLSWRNDVPYQKGARVFWHGSTFQALKDTTGTEPQGAGDNGVWYLVPVQNYPSSYDSVSGLGTAAKCDAREFDPAGAASNVYATSVQRDSSFRVGFQGGDILNPYIEHAAPNGVTTIVNVARSAWVSELQNSFNTFKNSVKSAAMHEAADFDSAGAASNAKAEAIGACVMRDHISTAGFTNGDGADPYFRHDDGTVVHLASQWKTDNAIEEIKKGLGTASTKNITDFDASGEAGKAKNDAIGVSVQRDTSRRAGFVGGDVLNPYIEHFSNGASTIVNLARSTWVSELQARLERAESNKLARDSAKVAGFGSGDKNAPYFRHDDGTVVWLAAGRDSNLSGTGWARIGQGGMMLQWGSFNTPPRGAGARVYFSRLFPRACISVTCAVNNAASQMIGFKDTALDSATICTGNEDPYSRSGMYLAIGY